MIDEINLGWQIIEGKKPILIVAGHNFGQRREGKIKMADLGTGDIARKICDKFRFWGIVSTREQMDPNWYTNSPFREEIKKIIKEKKIVLVIDIHGKSMAAENLVELIANKSFIKKYNMVTRDFNNPNQQNLVEELEGYIPAVEIEIREDGRVRTIDETKYFETENIINNLIEKLI